MPTLNELNSSITAKQQEIRDKENEIKNKEEEIKKCRHFESQITGIKGDIGESQKYISIAQGEIQNVEFNLRQQAIIKMDSSYNLGETIKTTLGNKTTESENLRRTLETEKENCEKKLKSLREQLNDLHRSYWVCYREQYGGNVGIY